MKPTNKIVKVSLLLLFAIGAFGVLARDYQNNLPDRLCYKLFSKEASKQKHKVSSNILILDIDNKSIKSLGQWPWPRYKIASLLTRISKDKPTAVAFDIVFPERDQTSLTTIKTNFTRDFGLVLNTVGIPDVLKNNDAYFASSLKTNPTIGSFTYSKISPTLVQNTQTPKPLNQTLKDIDFTGSKVKTREVKLESISDNIDILASSLTAVSFSNITLNHDSIATTVPSFIKADNIVYPNLALAVSLIASKAKEINISSDFIGNYITFADRKIRLDDKGEIRINYAQNIDIPRYSISDFINQDYPNNFFTDKIIFIGASAGGTGQYALSPLGLLPTTNIQALLTENLLSGQTIGTFKSFRLYSLISLIIICLFITWVCHRFSAIKTIIIYCLVNTVFIITCYLLFSLQAIYMPIASCLLLGFVYFAGIFSMKLFEQNKLFSYLESYSKQQQIALETMACVAESRSDETGTHIQRTSHYVACMANKLYLDNNPCIKSKRHIDQLVNSAPLHDIGKLVISDAILLKPARLTAEEFEEMKTHSLKGANLIESTAHRLSKNDSFLKIAAEMALTHHEKWDGSGYPHGLKGKSIPLAGRLMAVADVYDALLSERAYKKAFSHEKAKEIIIEGKGAHFDPELVDLFLELETEFIKITKEVNATIL